MVVMKFGGTSVFDAKRMQEVYNIVRKSAKKELTVVVLSSMKGTTEDLLQAAERAIDFNKKDTHNYINIYQKIYTRHVHAWNELVELSGNTIDMHPLPKAMQKILKDLEEILHGVNLLKESTPRTQDLIVSFGERLSCMLFSEFINLPHVVSTKKHAIRYNATYIDARKYIVTNDKHGSAGVFFDKTYKKLDKVFKNIQDTADKKKSGAHTHLIPIVTGFIAATEKGITTTIGRNGSDYSAAIIGAAINASRVEIWTDVDGVLSADPRIVSDAFLVPSVNYSEAMELSYFGAKVIHPQTVVPAIDKGIPISIKNTMNPDAVGTVISQQNKEHRFPITGLTSVKDVSVLTIEGAGISGNFYFLPDVFKVFASHHIQPLMITQSSSEHSISFILNTHEVHHMKEQLEIKFSDELLQKKIQNISVAEHHSIISVIGSHMKGTKGLAGRIFGTMGMHGINVIAIAQGSSEINVSFVIEKAKEKLAIQVLHHEFFGEFI